MAENATRRAAIVRSPPRIGLFMVGGLCAASAYALTTSAFDIAYPAITGAPKFAALESLALNLGPAYLFLHIFLHNLGLAALVPGVGLFAASFERNPTRRRVIGWILAGAVIVSLLVAAELIFIRGWESMILTLPLLAAESTAVIILTLAGVRVLRDFVPTRRPDWAWVDPARQLAPYVAVAVTGLAFSAFVETLYLWRTLGW
ncbi:MAG: hypothetical protein ACYDDF_03920 [Thermoplasmatota archaeon]